MLASLCIGSTSDDNGVPTDQCAVRLAKAGKFMFDKWYNLLFWYIAIYSLFGF